MTEQEQIDLEERQRGRKRKTDGNYASKYYDPDKAHEYYMKHRKLQAIKNGTNKKKSSGKKSSSRKTTKKSSSRKTTKKTGYSEKEKQILQNAKNAVDSNIADLKDTVADWVDKQEEQIDNLDTTGKSKEEKAKIEKQKKALRNRIKAVKREMNKQIRQARKIYRQYKTAYTQHNIEKFAADQAAAASKKSEGDKGNGTDDSKKD